MSMSNTTLKQAVAELYLRNDWLKKGLTGQVVIYTATDGSGYVRVFGNYYISLSWN